MDEALEERAEAGGGGAGGAAAGAVLAGFPVVIETAVAWGEMDALGHVNNVVYFRWFESGRIAYLDRIGFLGGGPGSAVGPILAETRCRFRRPLHWPDVVRIGARAVAVEEDRFTMEYRVVGLSAGVVAAEGSGVVVSYDYGANRKAALPAAVRAAIERVEGSDR